MTNLRFEQAMANAVHAAAVNEEASNPELAKHLHDTANQANKELTMAIDNMNMYRWKCEDCGETDIWVSAIIRHCDEQGHGNFCAVRSDDDQDDNETPIGLHGPECSTGKCRACNVSNRFPDY